MNLNRRRLLLTTGAAGIGLGLFGQKGFGAAPVRGAAPSTFEILHTDEEWRRLLTPAAYKVLRQQGTELPYSSPLNSEHASGVFTCGGCDLDLFLSKTKYDSHTGWPSFWQPIEKAVNEVPDETFGLERIEIQCRRCGGHLGHVFNDGPPPTGLRYCMNGAALKFKPVAAG